MKITNLNTKRVKKKFMLIVKNAGSSDERVPTLLTHNSDVVSAFYVFLQ
jgi:hypothetical protein